MIILFILRVVMESGLVTKFDSGLFVCNLKGVGSTVSWTAGDKPVQY